MLWSSIAFCFVLGAGALRHSAIMTTLNIGENPKRALFREKYSKPYGSVPSLSNISDTATGPSLLQTSDIPYVTAGFDKYVLGKIKNDDDGSLMIPYMQGLPSSTVNMIRDSADGDGLRNFRWLNSDFLADRRIDQNEFRFYQALHKVLIGPKAESRSNYPIRTIQRNIDQINMTTKLVNANREKTSKFILGWLLKFF
jgi:hypothetical protein